MPPPAAGPSLSTAPSNSTNPLVLLPTSSGIVSHTFNPEEVAIFLAPMKSTTWRAVRAALYSNVLGMLKKVTVQYTENDGSPGQELTSDFIVDTITTQKEKQVP